jgi:60 kDa SS-A/Ro ribonucleoprotein
MAKLNATKAKVTAVAVAEETTVNYEGATAYNLKAKDRLIEQVLGSFWNEKLFYTEGSTITTQIISDIKEIADVDPKFILQLAAYARNELYLRTAPQVLLVEAANIEKCKPFVRAYTPKIVKRADELSEAVAYQLSTHGKKAFPNSLKKGLADAFGNFDEYQLNKYDSSKSSVSLGDVAKLVHPPLGKPMYNYLTKDEVDAEALPKIGALRVLLAKDKIDDEAIELIRKSNVTWETLISKFGSNKETWSLAAPNMGYMALLRNLRNFEEKGVDLKPIVAKITDEEAVKRSKQLPFRFYSAYKQLESKQAVARAIAKAFEYSISNVTLDGDTAIMVDLSGSMESMLSDKSSVSYKEVAAVLGAIATKKSNQSVVIGFGDSAQEVFLNPDDTMMTNIQKIIKLQVGYSTNAWKAFDVLGTRKVDRIFLFSDMQCYDSGTKGYTPGYGWGYDQSVPKAVSKKWKEYLKINKDAYLYSFDLSAYGTKQTSSNQKNVVLLNGWSDKVIDYANIVEKRNVMESMIKKW